MVWYLLHYTHGSDSQHTTFHSMSNTFNASKITFTKKWYYPTFWDPEWIPLYEDVDRRASKCCCSLIQQSVASLAVLWWGFDPAGRWRELLGSVCEKSKLVEGLLAEEEPVHMARSWERIVRMASCFSWLKWAEQMLQRPSTLLQASTAPAGVFMLS